MLSSCSVFTQHGISILHQHQIIHFCVVAKATPEELHVGVLLCSLTDVVAPITTSGKYCSGHIGVLQCKLPPFPMLDAQSPGVLVIALTLYVFPIS